MYRIYFYLIKFYLIYVFYCEYMSIKIFISRVIIWYIKIQIRGKCDFKIWGYIEYKLYQMLQEFNGRSEEV